jgi:hypothetical protein
MARMVEGESYAMQEAFYHQDAYTEQIDAKTRGEAAQLWAMRAGMELAVCAAYSVIVRELLETGVDRRVLELCTAAGAEEVKHAQLCLDVAEALDLQTRPWPIPASLHVPSYDGVRSGSLLAALHLVAMSCLNESIACVRLAEAINLTKSQTVRRVLHQILRDEVQHARAGWAHLASAHVTMAMRADIGRFVPHLVESSLTGLVDENASIPSEDFAPLGLPSVEQARMHAHRAVREIVLPGFRRLNVPFDEASALRSIDSA